MGAPGGTFPVNRHLTMKPDKNATKTAEIAANISREQLSRRDFMKSSVLASAALPLTVASLDSGASAVPGGGAVPQESLPKGKIAGQEFSRLMMGGNLIAGWAHSRDLSYVSTLMRRYNTPAKIRETLELGESLGITAINSWVMDDNSQLFDHWKAGGKLSWFAQVRLDAGGGFSQIQKAIDQGAVGIHLTGDVCDSLLNRNQFDQVGETVRFIKSHQRIAGVAAHGLDVILECERRKLDVDFYQKTLHALDYFTGPKAGDTASIGANDNYWCNDPQAVIDAFAQIDKPWIAFKILAAGAIPPRAAFPYAFNNGADFILVGMFDWQVEENVRFATRVARTVASSNSKRTRPWY